MRSVDVNYCTVFCSIIKISRRGQAASPVLSQPSLSFGKLYIQILFLDGLLQPHAAQPTVVRHQSIKVQCYHHYFNFKMNILLSTSFLSNFNTCVL